MIRFGLIAVILSMSVLSGKASAQETLGEVLAKGAKKLNGAEVMKILTSGTLRGRTTGGGEVALQYKADGTLSGTVGDSDVADGKWASDANGKSCASFWLPAFNRSFDNFCRYWFKLGEVLYVAADSDSDSDKDAVMMQRTITPNAK
jgi:hypothetical protein